MSEKRGNAGFFHAPSIHPDKPDIETGEKRHSVRFSRKDSNAQGNWKMVSHCTLSTLIQTTKAHRCLSRSHQQTAREAFNIIDENSDGFLQKEEVVRAVEMMNEHGEMDLDGMTPVQLAEKMMKEVDIDGDGQIDIEEFTEMMKQSSTDKSGTIQNNHRMSQLAKNVLIAHQKKIENSTIGRDTWLIHPLSNFHATWDLLVSLLILLTVVTMPLSLGWEDINEDFFAMNLIVDFIFLLDVCKNFCTGFEDENEAIIMDASLVRRNYLTGFFATDFCSSIPLDLILKSVSNDLMNMRDKLITKEYSHLLVLTPRSRRLASTRLEAL